MSQRQLHHQQLMPIWAIGMVPSTVGRDFLHQQSRQSPQTYTQPKLKEAIPQLRQFSHVILDCGKLTFKNNQYIIFNNYLI